MSEEEIQKQLESFGDPYQMFWIELSGEHWYDLSDEQKAALIDHELCHCAVDFPEEKDEPMLYMRGHDIEEFEEVVARHGMWTHSLESFGAALMGFDGA